MHRSVAYTLTFAIAVAFVASILVATTSVTLRDRQETNRVLDRQRKVLDVAGLVIRDERLSDEEVSEVFDSAVQPIVIDLETGRDAPGVDPTTFDQRSRTRDPATSRAIGDNSAGVSRLPVHGLVYEVADSTGITALVLPIEGQGLWSTIYGYIALSPDLRSVQGITFYEHAETPGLGGEIDSDAWRLQWRDKQPFDDEWHPQLQVAKGIAPPSTTSYTVDGLAGATLTGRAVTNLVRFWLGELGYGRYLERYRLEAGIS